MATTDATATSSVTNGLRTLVTGATSGIGRAAAVRLGQLGMEVIVHGRNAERGEMVVKQIEAAGGTASFRAADLADPVALRALADDAGDIDILVNNAGFSWFGPTNDLDVATFDALFIANVRSAYFLVAAIAPRMAARGAGSIVNVGSMAGQIGLASGAAYSATKAALASFTRSWAAEYSPLGVRVNTVSPGPVYTEGASSDRTAALGSTTLLSRGADPAEIAEAIAFLASPASSYVTGTVLSVDGGRTAV